MFNFIHNLLSKFYFTKPSVHYIQPKSLNLRFKTGSEQRGSEKYFWVNLTNVSLAKPEIEQVKEENNNAFLLNFCLTYANGNSEVITVAKFETRKEAETAQNVLVSKLNEPEKSIVKFSLVVLILAFIWGLTNDIFLVTTQNISNSRARANTGMTQPASQTPNLTLQQQEELLRELQRQVPQAAPAPAPSNGNVVQTPTNPAVDSLIEGLGK